MKVLICGDRNWTDREAIRSWLCKLQDWGYDMVIEGGAKGADTIAYDESERIGMVVQVYPARWDLYGRAAGPIRNHAMLEENPDLVLAFHSDITKSKGTFDTIREAKRRGIPVILQVK